MTQSSVAGDLSSSVCYRFMLSFGDLISFLDISNISVSCIFYKFTYVKFSNFNWSNYVKRLDQKRMLSRWCLRESTETGIKGTLRCL